ncbi:hypothetical protein D3C86_2090500 [compost metagenome]
MWVCGKGSCQWAGKAGLTDLRYGRPVRAKPSVLMSSAAQPKGERPAYRIMYQNTQVKSKPAGKAMNTGLPGRLSTHST